MQGQPPRGLRRAVRVTPPRLLVLGELPGEQLGEAPQPPPEEPGELERLKLHVVERNIDE